ncbi:cytochrome P450 [Mycena olivaceomarginata]|nr:cytochrome P450 [Mycena olivaceomarginata]
MASAGTSFGSSGREGPARPGLAGERPHARSYRYPPGPPKLPLFGNLFDLPATFLWETYMEWSRQYNSDIIHLNFAGTSVIVLSSFEATDDLLEKRSAIYSDRRMQRRLFNQEFNVISSKNFWPKQRAATQAFLRRLPDDADGWVVHLRQMTGELIISVAYGIDTLPVNDPYIALAEKSVKAFSDASVPGRFLVESFPILKYLPEWMPGADFKRIARKGKDIIHTLRDLPFAEVKHQIAVGFASSSFTTDALLALESSDQYYEERNVKDIAASMYGAGADTTVSSLSTFILAMLANPETQKKAQLEIDSVIDKGNLPDFGDQEALPYVGALVQEILRWKNVAPFGVPHFLPVEDEYRGYRLPARSIVLGNIWAILHDEAMYPDPYAFKPERFLLDGKLNPSVRSPQASFGFGRRICPGRHMAISSMWITIASMLAVFDITKAVDEHGQVIEPSYEYLSGVVATPRPFQCSIRPRSQDAVALIKATANDV